MTPPIRFLCKVGLVLVHEFAHVRWGYQNKRDVDFLVHFFARREFDCGIDRSSSLTNGVLEDCHIVIARRHHEQGVLRRINAARLEHQPYPFLRPSSPEWRRWPSRRCLRVRNQMARRKTSSLSSGLALRHATSLQALRQ